MLNSSIDRSKPVVLTVVFEDLPSRLDNFLAKQADLGRNQVKRYIKSDCVTVARDQESLKLKPALKLKAGDKVTLRYPSKGVLPKPDIIYQDDDLVAINKPDGLLTHAKSGSDDEWTAQDMVQTLIDDAPRQGLVHRLDRGTSGVMIFARTSKAHQSLSNQFKEHRVTKNYLALVKGKPKTVPLVMDWPIIRDSKKRSSFIVKARGRQAVTNILSSQNGKGYSALLLQPITGRTHQLRVHLKKLGVPIVGDSIYNRSSKAPRMMLHAYKLYILSPSTNLPIELCAPIPESFSKFALEQGIKLESLL